MRAVAHYQVPLLESAQVANWVLQPDELDKRDLVLISVPAQTSQYAFAMHIHDNSMEAQAGVSFPTGSLIIADPECIVRDGSYVIVRLDGDTQPVFRQYVRDHSGTYLKPLNPKYPIRKLHHPQAIFCGVVKHMLMQVG